MFVVLFCLTFFGPLSGQPDISEDSQFSQLGSAADCQIFWSYFYHCYSDYTEFHIIICFDGKDTVDI